MENVRGNLGSAGDTGMSSASHLIAFPDILRTALCSLQETTEGKACSAAAGGGQRALPRFHVCSHHPAGAQEKGHGACQEEKGALCQQPRHSANTATCWPCTLELLPHEAAPSPSSAAGTRAAFHTHNKPCITLHSLELSGGSSFVFWTIVIVLLFVSFRFKQKLEVCEVPRPTEQSCGPGRAAGCWGQAPGALGSLSETLCQELTKRLLQTSEIKNTLTKQSVWQAGKFYPLNTFSVLLLCNFMDHSVTQ